MRNTYPYFMSIILSMLTFVFISTAWADPDFRSFKLNNNRSDSKLNSSLQGLVNELSAMAVTRGENQSFSDLSNGLLRVDQNGSVEVFLYCNEVGQENLDQLSALGLEVESEYEDLKILHGWMPYQNLETASEMGFVAKVSPPNYAYTRAGSETTEGDSVIGADDARDILGVDGSGIRIGVISDGVDSLGVSQATGDLPGNVVVGNNNFGGDEGTAMLEIIHDIAPGAQLYFHSAFPTSIQFLNAINFFMNNNVDIIVDDVGFLSEPYFQDGELAQKAEEAVENGIFFVSAAGNDATRHYQAFYLDDGDIDSDDDLHNFGAAAGGPDDLGMTYAIPGGARAVFFLQWSDPFGASSNDYDLYIVDSFTGAILNPTGQGVAVQDGNDDPIEFIVFDNGSFDTLFVEIIIEKFSGTPQTLELQFNFSGAITEYNVPQDSVFGHPAASGVFATAAFDWMSPNTIESFSSQGPVSIISPSDASVSTKALISESRQKPDISAPDGVTTTAPGFGTFFGTSAAAPHAAAVAALVKQALEASENTASSEFPDIETNQVQEIRNTLTSTAVDLGQPGVDNISGFGRIDAFAAVQQALGGVVITPPPDSDNNDDGGGGCSLHSHGTGKMKDSHIANILILLIPVLIVGLNTARRRK